ncbi:MAG TPA: peptidoglycan-binding protein, partial [Nitrososphaeraceae archaeon]|nr:peptidoglycan-binding protein [Nitrososphaeraceae archaeon]
TDEIQMDTNGDGVVDALDEATPTEADTSTPTEADTSTPTETTTTDTSSSTDEIQMDTNGDGVVDALDEATPTEAVDADAINNDDYLPDITSKPCNPNSPTLRIGKDGTVGSKGPKVTELQNDLADLGYEKFLGPPGIDGKFGPYTEGAVKQFQIDNGLKGKNGIAGPETWAAICDLLSLPNKSKFLYQSQQFNCNPNSDTLQVGSENEKVIELQTYLTDLGYGDLLEPEKIDGKFGPHTKNAVMTYQKDFGLTVDGNGIVGTQTWGSLCEQISLLPKTSPTTSVQPPGEGQQVPIPEFRCDNTSQNKLPFCYDTCGDNIDNDADGQADDLDPEGCEPGRKVYDMKELSKLNNKISDKLNDLKEAAVATTFISVEDDVKFANAVNEFSNNIKRQVLDAVSKNEHMSIPQIITVESLRLWVDDPGNQWGEGSWDSNDLVMSASCYVIVPASQNKCNVYVAEVIFLATGITFKVYESEEKPGQYFPFKAKDWGNKYYNIPHFVTVNNPQMGDIWSNGGHTGIYLGEYNGVKLYISARDDGEGVYGLDSVQHKHGIQIKQLPEGGVYRTFSP